MKMNEDSILIWKAEWKENVGKTETSLGGQY